MKTNKTEEGIQLNERGQCPYCLIKPLTYKRDHHYFCHRCCRIYDMSTKKMMPNSHWNANNTTRWPKQVYNCCGWRLEDKHAPGCQKEQPEQEVHDKLMNMALDHAKSAAYPPVLFTPPQELRQEEWEDDVYSMLYGYYLDKREFLDQNMRTLQGQVLNVDKKFIEDLKRFVLPKVEQKARAEAFKAVKALVPIESYSYYNDYGWKRVYDINDVPENYPKEHIRKHYPDEWHEFYESLLKLQKS